MEKCHGTDDLVLVGIQRRGVQLAERLAKLIESTEGHPIVSGKLDITLCRDDLPAVVPPGLGNQLPADLDGKTVVIVDDVLYTGRQRGGTRRVRRLRSPPADPALRAGGPGWS